MVRDRRPDAALITRAAPSFSTEQAHRRRRYTILMAIHLIGFALGGVLYYDAWWLGLALLIITTPLPWVAVILANSPSRPFRRASRVSHTPGQPARQLRAHPAINHRSTHRSPAVSPTNNDQWAHPR